MSYTYDNIGQLKRASGWEPDDQGGQTLRLHERFGYAYDAAWNLNYRTNNALVQTFGVNNLNELSAGSRSGTLTVAGTAGERRIRYDGDIGVTNVTVSGTGLASGAATLYADGSWARAGATPANGQNSYTATAQDSYGRTSQDTASVNLPSSVSFSYDGNGNLLNDGRRYFEYDSENQLTNVYMSGQWRSEFVYDGLLRRRVRKEFTWSGSSWVKTNEVRYIYDARVVVQERDANNLALVSYTRGTDLSGTRQGAGGIGGLLARTDNSTFNPQVSTALYHCDGNGNVTCLINASNAVVAQYAYDPYGNTLAIGGSMANGNLYRFSSKECHPNSGTVYYLYRYYDPNLQRWLNRDPLGDIASLPLLTVNMIPGSDANNAAEMTDNEILTALCQINLNLYNGMENDPVGLIDLYGLSCEPNPDLAKLKEVQGKIREAFKFMKGSESSFEKRMVQHELQELFTKERLLKQNIEAARAASQLARSARVARLAGRGGLVAAAAAGGYLGGRVLWGSTPYAGGGTIDQNVQETTFEPFWNWWYGCPAP